MKIEWAKNKKIPLSHLAAGQCFTNIDNDICLACEDGWSVILATGEIFAIENPDSYEVIPISAKVVVLEVTD